ncbi:hypothetical protein HK100_006136, partial [Physocladia obscura]
MEEEPYFDNLEENPSSSAKALGKHPVHDVSTSSNSALLQPTTVQTVDIPVAEALATETSSIVSPTPQPQHPSLFANLQALNESALGATVSHIKTEKSGVFQTALSCVALDDDNLDGTDPDDGDADPDDDG